MKLRNLILTAMFAAIICVASPWSIPLGPIPLTLCTLALYLTALLLGWKKSAAATVIFLLIGGVGVPVFAGFSGGFQKLAGPTGGFLIGYIPMVILIGLASQLFHCKVLPNIIGLILGTAVLYAFGTVWYCISYKATFVSGLVTCVVPFLIGDAIKIAAALALAAALKKPLSKWLSF